MKSNAAARQTSITPPSGIPAQLGREQQAALCRVALEQAMYGATADRLKQIRAWLERAS